VKTSTQLKALVRNLSKEKNIEAEIILRNFMLERLLERISVSKYKNNFILKGGILLTAMVGIATRTTMDLDATIKGQTLTASEIGNIINDILNIVIEDDVILTLKGIEEIRDEVDYPGFRVSIEAVLDKTRQTLKVDITTGDIVTPKEIEYHFCLMFENRSMSVMAYNLETVLAEKFETIITRGITNTRMRDFYDVYILTVTQNLDTDTFRTALAKTVEKRNTTGQMADPLGVISTVEKSSIMMDLWKRYQKKYSYAASVTWETVIEALTELGRN
jgi:predicted nucleotidyltransferase component of viral defense system